MEQKIIDKIRKMFALANNAGATKGESDNAMRMANKLLEKHNLSMMDLEVQEDIDSSVIFAKPEPWVRIVVNSVARLYSCSYYYSSADEANYIIGADSQAPLETLIVSNKTIGFFFPTSINLFSSSH